MERNAIATEEEHDNSSPDAAHLENLANFIEAYEDKNYTIPQPNSISRASYFFGRNSFFHR